MKSILVLSLSFLIPLAGCASYPTAQVTVDRLPSKSETGSRIGSSVGTAIGLSVGDRIASKNHHHHHRATILAFLSAGTGALLGSVAGYYAGHELEKQDHHSRYPEDPFPLDDPSLPWDRSK